MEHKLVHIFKSEIRDIKDIKDQNIQLSPFHSRFENEPIFNDDTYIDYGQAATRTYKIHKLRKERLGHITTKFFIIQDDELGNFINKAIEENQSLNKEILKLRETLSIKLIMIHAIKNLSFFKLVKQFLLWRKERR